MQNLLLKDDGAIFAPVLIPTLNRVNHLRRCLNSLSNNNWADKTVIYISIDYPPCAKYEEGYLDLVKMINTYDFSCFYGVHIYYQNKNIGPSGNFSFLIDKVVQDGYDRYILTEDDNEFSPNFLEYINKGLSLFENNDNIVQICGCADTNWYHDDKDNFVNIKIASAYGVGLWHKKRIKTLSEASCFLLNPQNHSLKRMLQLFSENSCLFSHYILGIIGKSDGLYWSPNGNLNLCDTPLSIYLHLNNKYVIAPVISKSRTFGNDGSGLNMPKESDNGMKVIDKNPNFDFSRNIDLQYYELNNKIGNKYMHKALTNKTLVKAFCVLLLYYIVNKNRSILIKLTKILHI